MRGLAAAATIFGEMPRTLHKGAFGAGLASVGLCAVVLVALGSGPAGTPLGPAHAEARCGERLAATYNVQSRYPKLYASQYKKRVKVNVTTHHGPLVEWQVQLYTFQGKLLGQTKRKRALNNSDTVRVDLKFPMQPGKFTIVIKGYPRGCRAESQMADVVRFSDCTDRLPVKFPEKPGGVAADYEGRIEFEDPAANGARFDELSAADLIDRARVRGDARLLLETWIRDDYGVEASELSLLGMALGELPYYGQPGGVEIYRVRGGNSALAAALASRSGAEIHLSTPVTRIEREADGVRVDAGSESFEGAWCMLAAPLPALRGIEFKPALPEALAGAVEEMQYARVTKTMVQYRRRFWRRRGLTGDTLTDLPLGTTWEATDGQRGRRGVLISYAAGRRRDQLVAASGGDQPAAVTRGLDRVYPGSGELALTGAAVDWAGEPYSGGCWMQAAPGQVVPFWRAIREPVGRVVLAGEHTSTMPGYMEGAFRSGIAAAGTITDAR